MEIKAIYKFPEGYASKWTVIYEGDQHFTSFSMENKVEDVVDFINKYNLESDNGGPISYWLDTSFGKLAMECVNGQHEEFRVWPAPANASRCKCPPIEFLRNGHLDGCPEKPIVKRYSYL